ncbi:hypothetical protein JK628_04075 [Shewanella sp. KX20019]|uniref:hypothetical protein n=1 Tax=Shewanella sp. KX20019 TaxID=2803864 RepID=UPI00192884B8|nr:hypothetical protein [Shewanella sp. KX20019]QQX81059.1 hypothetical protein JK628_04075 [Shewanella sp. KX20019]
MFIVIAVIGVALLLIPTEFILAFDGQTGRWLYEHAKDKEKGVSKARKFYRLLGASCLIVSVSFLIFT